MGARRMMNVILCVLAAAGIAKASSAEEDRGLLTTFEIIDGERVPVTTNNETLDLGSGATTDIIFNSNLPRAKGTNFKAGEPFQFRHIYFLGGDCGNEDEGWYQSFILAGLQTLEGSEIVCPPNPQNYAWWTREFHLLALAEVELLAGEYLDETLVVTVGVGLGVDWTPVADLMRRGLSFFHAKEDPLELRNFNLAEHGLLPEDILYLYFQWDEVSAADRNGVELCRLLEGNRQLKIAKIYTGGRDVPLNYRVDLALESFKRECDQTDVIEVWEIYHNVSDDSLASILMFNPIPDIIMVDSDHIAGTMLDIAKGVLTEEEYNDITTVGWDNIYPDLLTERKMLVTVDQMVHYPKQGVWRAIHAVVTRAQTSGLNSTAAIQGAMDRGNSMTMSADALTVSGDRAGFLTSTLLTGYNPDFPPSNDVRVTTGILGVTITKMDPFEGNFEAVLWEKLSWRDPRLTWNPIIYNEELPIDSSQIWTPQLYYGNEYDKNELYEAPIMLAFNGYVVMQRNIRAQFLCSTTEDLKRFPFDSYDCAIDLGAPNGVTLDQNYGFEIIESDPHYATEWFTEGNVAYFRGNTTTKNVVHYNIVFTRRPFTTYMRLILPAILINLIGFMAFWIPELPESVALGITALLCSLAFRETVDMPDTASVTWTEVFMMINISYLASVMFITWCSYSSSTALGHYLNKLCKPLKPRQIRKRMRRRIDSLKDRSTRSRTRDTSNSERGRINEDLRKIREEMEMEARQREQSRPESVPPRSKHSDHNSKPMQDTSGHSTNSYGPEHLVPQKSKVQFQESAGTGWDSYRSDQEIDVDELDETSFQELKATRASQRASLMANGVTDARYKQESMYISKHTRLVAQRNIMRGGDEDGNEKVRVANVDWIGRWFIVPSYIVVITTLLIGGWGFK